MIKSFILRKSYASFKDGDMTSPNQIPLDVIYEHEQNKVLIDIVETIELIAQSNPASDVFAIQLKPLKKMFDRIDRSGIKSDEGKIIYQQVLDYFNKHLGPENNWSINPNNCSSTPCLTVDFDGKDVISTNYYTSDWSNRGFFYCVPYSNVLHLFVPEKNIGTTVEQILSELNSAEYVIASVCESESSRYYLELLFEDYSNAPYSFHLSAQQVVPHLSKEDCNMLGLEFNVHTGPRGKKRLAFPLKIRFVDYLPYGKPWNE